MDTKEQLWAYVSTVARARNRATPADYAKAALDPKMPLLSVNELKLASAVLKRLIALEGRS